MQKSQIASITTRLQKWAFVIGFTPKNTKINQLLAQATAYRGYFS
jgi:hypothetical protein